MEDTITIVPVQGTDLLRVYPRQLEPQPAYVELDLRSRRLCADYNAEVGTAMPAAVYHGHTLRWPIPPLRGEDATSLLRELAPLAARILAGYRSEWDGQNQVGRLSPDAEDAAMQIADVTAGYDDAVAIGWCDAGDWLHDIDVRSAIAERLAAGETVEALEAELQGDGSDDRPVLTGLTRYLEWLRNGRA